MSIIKQALDTVSAHGGWGSVFQHYPSVMVAANRALSQVPCPFTGNGKTKFRLYKDWEQTGAGYHNDFGRIATGIDMIMKLEPECGNNPGKAAKLIVKLLGGSAVATSTPKCAVTRCVPKIDEHELKRMKGTLDALLNRSVPSARHQLYKSYCESRGIPAFACSDLRIATGVFHRDANDVVTHKNALLGIMRKPNGEIMTVHRIYLDENGHGIKGKNRKMMLPPPAQKGEVNGCAIRLSPTKNGPRGNILALTEGIETGLAVMAGSKLPVWACYSSALLESVIIPNEVEKVIIFADNDYNGGQGLTSAEVLATRLRAAGKCVRILVPIEPNGLENITKKGVDWLDVYNHSLAEFKHQVRECLKLDL